MAERNVRVKVDIVPGQTGQLAQAVRRENIPNVIAVEAGKGLRGSMGGVLRTLIPRVAPSLAAGLAGSAGGAIGGVGGLVGGGIGAAVGGALGGPAGALAGAGIGGSIGTLLGQVLGKIEPIAKVFSDVAAIIGERLEPLFKAMGDYFRIFGDVIATILPSQQQMNELAQAFAPLIDEMRTRMATLAPVIAQLVSIGLTVLTKGIQLFGDVVVRVSDLVRGAVATLADTMALMARVTGQGALGTALSAAASQVRNPAALASSVRSTTEKSKAASGGASFMSAEQLGQDFRRGALEDAAAQPDRGFFAQQFEILRRAIEAQNAGDPVKRGVQGFA